MDCRAVVFFCLAILLALLISYSEGRRKKVVIHVPYKLKKIKHTHTVYKTVHHHHSHHDHLDSLLHSPSEDHEHFHHMHIHEEQIPSGQHSQPVPGIGIPEFLPDVHLELPIEIPDIPHDMPSRHNLIPLFRRP